MAAVQLAIDVYGQNVGNNNSAPITAPSAIPYGSTRGLMIPKVSQTVSNALLFQFNPTDLSFTKGNIWETRKYVGRSDTETFWVGGDNRTLKFKLMFDATNSVVQGDPVKMVGNSSWDLESSANSTFQGTLPYTNKLESYVYPTQVGNNTPIFVRGNVQVAQQFVPPATIIFVFGTFYFETKVTSLDVVHTCWNKYLVPVRSEANLELTILEGYSVNTNYALVDYANASAIPATNSQIPSNGSLNTVPPNTYDTAVYNGD